MENTDRAKLMEARSRAALALEAIEQKVRKLAEPTDILDKITKLQLILHIENGWLRETYPGAMDHDNEAEIARVKRGRDLITVCIRAIGAWARNHEMPLEARDLNDFLLLNYEAYGLNIHGEPLEAPPAASPPVAGRGAVNQEPSFVLNLPLKYQDFWKALPTDGNKIRSRELKRRLKLDKEISPSDVFRDAGKSKDEAMIAFVEGVGHEKQSWWRK